MNGKIKSLKEHFGFIRCDEDGFDCFFHESDLVDDFDPGYGDRVTFEVVEPKPERGRRAKNVSHAGTEGSLVLE